MKSKILLENTSGKIDMLGNPTKTRGFYATNKKNQTISIHSTNLVGRIWLYGSLLENPSEEISTDWFPIPLTEETLYKEYNNFHPPLVKRQTDIINIEGNFAWLMAKLDRSSYILVQDAKNPADYRISYVITSGTNVEPYFSMNNYTPNLPDVDVVPIPPEPLLSHMSYDLGSVEKIMLCY